MVKIAIDAMGAEGNEKKSGLEIVVKGASEANQDCEIILVGDEQELSQYNLDKRVSIHNASEIIGMEEEPNIAVKRKRDSSIVNATRLVKKGKADILLSPGNTGATVVAAGGLGRLDKKLKIPAIAITLPNRNGEFTVLLDCGAYPECDEKGLFYFSLMGAAFYSCLFGKDYPSVGLINMGVEHYKGTEEVRKADEILREFFHNYTGFMEGNDIIEGKVDVAVCNGYVGNVALKICEGTAKAMRERVREMGYNKDDLAIKRMNHETYGGGVLLGFKKPVVIAHGSSSSDSIKNALEFACRCNSAFPEIRDRIIKEVEEYSSLL